MESVNVGLWSIVPPLIAIILALITKEVVFSLVVGIFSGAAIYSFATQAGIIGAFYTTSELIIAKLSDGANASIILFLALLGALVAVITQAGGSQAYGKWAAGKLKTPSSAKLATSALGVLIFIDDYFNCLTVGTVMRPVTDAQKISREKLAYIIDATAAPVCIIAPISSWAAAVMSQMEGTGLNGMTAFLQSVPFNLYAVLTLVMVITLSIRKNGEYGPMAAAEAAAQVGGVVGDNDSEADDVLAQLKVSEKGKVFDLMIPIGALIVFCILAMMFVGGFWDGTGKSVAAAFGDTSAGNAMSLGGIGALVVAFFMFVPRKLVSFKEFFKAVGTGVVSMVPAYVILTLAWTISAVCRELLGTGPFVASMVEASNMPYQIIPAIIFLVAAFLSFSMGTAWGTFGILIPIIATICQSVAPHLTIIALAATLAGSVFGDHCSPISDTTILASTGAGCNHIKHVSTQLPYALTVAVCCFIGYLVAGVTASLVATLIAGLASLGVALYFLPKVWGAKKAKV